jgi:two-component system response regulator GlrR
VAGPLFCTPREPGELARRRWQLRVLEGPDRGLRAQLSEGTDLIGAASAATLVLNDDTVSRFHAEVEARAEGVHVRDLDSTNGTFVGPEARIAEAFLEDGETFRVGSTTVGCIAIDEPVASELETDPQQLGPGAVERVGPMVAASPRLRELFRAARRLAPSSAPVLFEGEPGVGKSSLARLIHALGPRRDSPLVEADLSRLAPDAVATTLFGLPARDGEPRAPGLLERAHGGTLLLLHVERLPASLEPMLLTALERRALPGPAPSRPQRLDVRVISTRASGAAPTTRLGRHLSTVRLLVPPLAERPEDVGPLAEVLLGSAARPGPRTLAELSSDGLPGNMPTLASRLFALRPPLPLPPEGPARDLATAQLSDLLGEERGSVTQAARRLGTSDHALFRALAAAGVELGPA